VCEQSTIPPVSVPPAVQMRLRDECRIMQGLARACERFGEHQKDAPETEELLYAVAAQWEKLYEILLWVSGQEPWPNSGGE
jgi:hypothetical protein